MVTAPERLKKMTGTWRKTNTSLAAWAGETTTLAQLIYEVGIRMLTNTGAKGNFASKSLNGTNLLLNHSLY
jgi:hypothetical protein